MEKYDQLTNVKRQTTTLHSQLYSLPRFDRWMLSKQNSVNKATKRVGKRRTESIPARIISAKDSYGKKEAMYMLQEQEREKRENKEGVKQTRK